MLKTQDKLITSDCTRSYLEVDQKLEPLKGKTLLITGGTGFMGSWVAEMVHYMNQAHNMDITLYLMGRSQTRFENNLPHLINAESIKFIYTDVLGRIVFPKEVNYIIHAAANPDSRYHATNPFESMRTVADGSASVFESASLLSDLKSILNVSSSAIYSKRALTSDKFCEDDLGTFSINNYLPDFFSDSNLYVETLCSAAISQMRLPIVNVRPFTFCGPHQNIDSPWALNNFINDAINKRPVRIHGDGSVIRSYMYGSDLAIWVLVILLHGKNGQTYNIGSSEGITLKKLAEIVVNSFIPSPQILLNSFLIKNTNQSILLPDTEKAEKELGLKLFTKIDKSIERSIEWYKSEKNYVE
jgi:nucleoside-diphosphate-sugar epimerase